MTLRTIVAGAGTLTVGRVLSQTLALGRHVIVGRLLRPDDLGVAALLMVTSALLELMTHFSVDKLLVQARDGDDPELQGVAQLFLTARGLALGLAALMIASPLAQVFRIPEAAWAFAAFGAVPVLAGLRHLDCKRAHRRGRFASDMLVEVAPQAIATALAWPLLMWIGGYAGVLWLLVLKAALGVGASHLVAKRTYRWAWSPPVAKRILSFGWPLLAGSALLFAVTQGDQLIVGSAYSMRALGLYAVAATLALALATMISSISSTLMLPALAARADDRLAFSRTHAAGVIAHALIATATGVLMIFAGSIMISFLYGSEYAEAGSLLGWLGVMQAIRLMRVSPTVACIARGDTLSPMITSICRGAALPAALALAAAGFDIVWLIVAGIGAEMFALVVLGLRVRRVHGIEFAPTFAATAAMLGVFAIMLFGTSVLGSIPGAAAAAVVVVGVCVLGFSARDRWAKRAAEFRWIPEATQGITAREAAS